MKFLFNIFPFAVSPLPVVATRFSVFVRSSVCSSVLNSYTLFSAVCQVLFSTFFKKFFELFLTSSRSVSLHCLWFPTRASVFFRSQVLSSRLDIYTLFSGFCQYLFSCFLKRRRGFHIRLTPASPTFLIAVATSCT